jgi:A/G-specific adenine glycosylase
MLRLAAPIVRRCLLRWYDRAQRDLPWRARAGERPNPYYVLVSESMLQQTQVATVIPYFTRFIERFPTVKSLAYADEQDVLRMWQGLGYYSRARNLLSAARLIEQEFGGVLPSDVPSLLRLPGVGRYTAGAIASIAFNRPEPILDGNVARVICRLDRIESADVRDRQTVAKLWTLAGELVPKSRPGDFNQAMMELGALVCTPRNPQCLVCPVKTLCQAVAAGVQDRIPAPRKARLTPLVRRRTFCVQRDDGKWLIEQRPARGRWPGMWQFVTVDRPIPLPRARKIGRIRHALTHRRYEFDVYRCTDDANDNGRLQLEDRPRRWVSLTELSEYPLPKPHVRIARMLCDEA